MKTLSSILLCLYSTLLSLCFKSFLVNVIFSFCVSRFSSIILREIIIIIYSSKWKVGMKRLVLPGASDQLALLHENRDSA